jgi:hypothetical protein
MLDDRIMTHVLMVVMCLPCKSRCIQWWLDTVCVDKFVEIYSCCTSLRAIY